jgi:1,4-dihydroxy-2-naphthoate octaprenyltransferase
MATFLDMKTVKFWYRNSRPHSLPQSVMPATVAFTMAANSGGFVWWIGMIAVAGVALAHLSINLFDDYFDYRVKKSDFRERLAHRGIRSRIHKCPYLVSGATTLGRLLAACIATGGIAAVAGVIILYYRGITVVYIAALAAALGVSYSGAPLRLSYRGLGEAVIGLMFGPLSMLGVYFSACGELAWNTLFISIPIGLLVANIIYVHSIMDYEPDCEVGKVTFATVMKTRRAMLAALAVLLTVAYASVAAGIIFGGMSVYLLLTFLTLPVAIRLFYLMVQFVKNPDRVFKPEWWTGPAGNFENMQKAGIGWFMVRWLTARNLLSVFCVIVILVELFF